MSREERGLPEREAGLGLTSAAGTGRGEFSPLPCASTRWADSRRLGHRPIRLRASLLKLAGKL